MLPCPLVSKVNAHAYLDESVGPQHAGCLACLTADPCNASLREGRLQLMQYCARTQQHVAPITRAKAYPSAEALMQYSSQCSEESL